MWRRWRKEGRNADLVCIGNEFLQSFHSLCNSLSSKLYKQDKFANINFLRLIDEDPDLVSVWFLGKREKMEWKNTEKWEWFGFVLGLVKQRVEDLWGRSFGFTLSAILCGSVAWPLRALTFCFGWDWETPADPPPGVWFITFPGAPKLFDWREPPWGGKKQSY